MQSSSTSYSWLRGLLSRPHAPRNIAWASLLLSAFCLDTGVSADDYVHELIMRSDAPLPSLVRDSPLDVFNFISAGGNRKLMEDGVTSWWSDPDGQLSFFRPLSSLTHYIDHQLWPDLYWVKHLHSMLWGALVIFGIFRLYKSLLGMSPMLFALALYLYALDDARGWFASWIAARNATIATAFSVWAMVFHQRLRAEGYAPGRWLAPLCLLLGLLAGDGAISICAYLFAYALFLDQGTLRQRLLTLAPYAVVVVAWRIVYKSMGYGVVGSGLYFDPVGDPVGFGLAVLEHAPILLYAQLGGPWSDFWTALFVFPVTRAVVYVAAIGTAAAVGWLITPLVKRHPVAQFGLVGALLSLLPASAVFPADRMLSWIGIGVSLVLAHLMALYMERPAELGLSARGLKAARVGVGMLVVIHIVLGPLFMSSRARGNIALRAIVERADSSVPRDPSISERVVVYANPPAVPLVAYIPLMRAAQGVPRPITQRWFATSTTELLIERLDAHTLRVRPRGGFHLNPSSKLLLPRKRRFSVGEEVHLPPMHIRVTKVTQGGRPLEVTARFDVPLEDPKLLWLRWDHAHYAPFTPPAIGERVIMPAADYTQVVVGDVPLTAYYSGSELDDPEAQLE